jgi:uncharacterized membrane protein YdjX (TVP38/TMEM64 family)
MFLSKKRAIVFICLLTVAALVWLTGVHQYLTFENVRENRDVLLALVEQNYLPSVFIFLTVYVMTAFFIPGTLALTAAAGFLFGFTEGTLFSLAGACLGATMAFLTSRFMIGAWIQKRFNDQLEAFNREIALHGIHYLIVFRIVPLLPFFMVNYLAGMTHISKWTFIWTTAAGMLPGALVCTYAGQKLATISSPENIFSAEVIVSLLLLAALVLLPALIHHARRLLKP